MKQPQFLIHVLLETYEHTLGLFPNQDLSSFGRWQENEILARYLARPVTPKGSVPNFIQCGTKLIMTRHNINDWEMDSLCSLLLRPHKTPLSLCRTDIIQWKCNAKGMLIVKSSYEQLRPTVAHNWTWKCIRRNKAPLEIERFPWFVTKEASLTHENLRKGKSTSTAGAAFVRSKMRMSIICFFIALSPPRSGYSFSTFWEWFGPCQRQRRSSYNAGISKGWEIQENLNGP